MHVLLHKEGHDLLIENELGVKELLFLHDRTLPPRESQNNSMQIHLQPSYEGAFGRIQCVLIGHKVSWGHLCHIIRQEYNQKA